MYYIFNKSCIGYSHIKNHKKCQDFSSSYKDNERTIITCADGHGGNIYLRSDIGSKLACDALLTVFKSIDKKFLCAKSDEEVTETIKLLTLCEYNKLVERELANNPLKKKELNGLTEDEIDNIRFNPQKAYGTTLAGAMIYKKRLYVVSIGDTEVLAVKNTSLFKIFDNSDDPAGNVTYSMCQEDAYSYLRVRIMNENEINSIFLCTDGLSSPYQNYQNLFNSFIDVVTKKVKKTKSTSEVEKGIEKLALELGNGDDVSLSFLINSKGD